MWLDPSHILASPGSRIEPDTAHEVHEPRILGLDGSTQMLWSSPTRWFYGLARSPDGTIYGDSKDMHVEMLIYGR